MERSRDGRDAPRGCGLRGCAAAMLAHRGTDAATILGPLDALKLRSCATLFARVADGPGPFAALLEAFYEGRPCPLNEAELAAG
jgi:uncharacterized protein (DUF1810 family)